MRRTFVGGVITAILIAALALAQLALRGDGARLGPVVSNSADGDAPPAAIDARWNNPLPAPDANGVVVGRSFINDVSPPVRSLTPGTSVPADREGMPREADKGSVLPMDTRTGVSDPAVQRSDTVFGGNASAATTATVRSFSGMSYANSCCVPPDTNGAVGPRNYVQTVNSAFQVFRKDGTAVTQPMSINRLWTGSGGSPCEIRNDGDPIVLYDHLADRWVISQFTTTPPYDECIAVSTSGDPAGTYYRYGFQLSTTNLADYPHLSVWPDGYYMSANMFADGTSFIRPQAFVFDRAAMLAGQPATVQLPAVSGATLGSNSDPLLPVDLDGGLPPVTGTPAYFAETYSGNSIRLWKFTTTWGSTPSSTLKLVSTSSGMGFSAASCGGSPRSTDCVAQPGTAEKLDTVGSRLMFRAVYRNFGDHEAIFLSHTVAATTSPFQAAVRWYEIRNPGSSTPTVTQFGTYAPDTTSRWMGSIDADRQGNIALAYNVASGAIGPGIRYVGRAAADPLNIMTTGETSLTGVACAACDQSGVDRWGDYSSLEVDPTDNCTFWFTGEYAKTASSASWYTKIGEFRFSNCTNTAALLQASGSAQATAGSYYPVTVTVKDSTPDAPTGIPGNVDTAYSGTIHLTSTDGAAVLPADYTFTPRDSGSHTFLVKFNTTGAQTLTATDTSNGTLTVVHAVNVNPAPASLALNAPASGNTGASHAVSIDVTLEKGDGSTETTYGGTVHFSSSDTTALLPADYTYTSSDAGTRTFQVTFSKPGNKTVTVKDTGNGSLAGTSSTIRITAINTWASPSGSDGNSCSSGASPCKTIQAAVNRASPGGIVNLAAGTYQELVQFSQNLTLKGPSARTTFISGAGLTGSVVGILPGVTASLSGVTVENGTTASNGGGLAVDGTLTATNIAVTGNTAGYGSLGGGIMVESGGKLTLQRSLVANNTLACTGGCDGYGAGMYNRGTTLIVNSTFTGNDATPVASGGGDGAIRARAGSLTLDNVTISGNLASAGSAGIDVPAFATAFPTISNTIISGNTGTSSPDCSGKLTSAGNNLLGNGSGCTGLTNGTNGDMVAPAAPGANLGALADNGGPTMTMALLSGSKAIDAGNSTACAVKSTVNNLDQRGSMRPVGTACDIGAFEAAGP